MVQHEVGAAGGPPCYNTIPAVVPQGLGFLPSPGLTSRLRQMITHLFGCEVNHKLGTEIQVLISNNKFVVI